jgi:hypothetical protein
MTQAAEKPTSQRKKRGRQSRPPDFLGASAVKANAPPAPAAHAAKAAAREFFDAVDDAEVRALPGVAEIFTQRHRLHMIAKPPTAHYQAFKKEMKRLEGAAAASAAAETAPPVACSIACQTEGGDPELLLPVACPTEDSARDSASGEAGPPTKKAKKTRKSKRLRAPEEIIAELEDQVKRMDAARNKLYGQKFFAKGKRSKLEGDISKLQDEKEKTEEEFDQKFKELNAEVRRYAAIARVKDVEADELAQQIKEMEKEVPNEMISDIEDDLLHFTFEMG